jgi:hypothetical protein
MVTLNYHNIIQTDGTSDFDIYHDTKVIAVEFLSIDSFPVDRENFTVNESIGEEEPFFGENIKEAKRVLKDLLSK